MRDKKTIVLLVILAILVVIAGGVLIYKVKNSKKAEPTVEVNEPVDVAENSTLVVSKQNQIKIFNGTDRPIAVMIDNHSGAWPQANLNKAYLVYEIVVEGGETRLMALFKGQNLDKIGPVRSSRHYFLDYALENDAIYVHHGWSPQAQSDISTLGVNNINGIQESSASFWRVKDKSAPHNLFTSTDSILKIAERKGYSKTSDKKSVLNYVANEVEMPAIAVNATSVTIPHSNLQTVKYEYDAQNKTYKRYARNKLQTDYITGETITVVHTLVNLERKLPDNLFIRIHRSYIINVHHVEGLIGNMVYIDKKKLPVSNPYYKELAACFNILEDTNTLFKYKRRENNKNPYTK